MVNTFLYSFLVQMQAETTPVGRLSKILLEKALRLKTKLLIFFTLQESFCPEGVGYRVKVIRGGEILTTSEEVLSLLKLT